MSVPRRLNKILSKAPQPKRRRGQDDTDEDDLAILIRTSVALEHQAVVIPSFEVGSGNGSDENKDSKPKQRRKNLAYGSGKVCSKSNFIQYKILAEPRICSSDTDDDPLAIRV